jgi:hypothetical protein
MKPHFGTWRELQFLSIPAEFVVVFFVLDALALLRFSVHVFL